MRDDIPAIWLAAGPEDWPSPPDRMSFSLLRQMEVCPRRWALSAATYPQIWDGRSYPKKLRVATTIGQVVHLALEKITEALVSSGCSSVEDPNAVMALKDLGGYTYIINECIDIVLERHEKNPRALKILKKIWQEIRSQLSGIREQVQIILTNLCLHPRDNIQMTADLGSVKRGKLGLGSYPEVRLSATEIGWVGVADLVNISETECEIVDFKTGEPREEHSLQLQVYSLLWSRDSELNPTSRHATKLTLSYTSGNFDVNVPSSKELDDLEQELIDRTQEALSAASKRPPEARANLDTCKYCGVRQICDEYWKSLAHGSFSIPSSEKSILCDLEVTVDDEHGPLSWDATVKNSTHIVTGDKVLLRPTSDDISLQTVLSNAGRVRILDAYLAALPDDKNEPRVLNLGSRSEVFLVI